MKEEQESLETIKSMLAKQSVMIDRIATKIFPQNSNFDFLPLKTLEELSNIDEIIKSIPDFEIVSQN